MIPKFAPLKNYAGLQRGVVAREACPGTSFLAGAGRYRKKDHGVSHALLAVFSRP